MYPILINAYGIVLPAWHLFFALGVMLGYLVLVHLWRTTKPAISRCDLDLLFILCYAGGYFGARAFSIWIEGDERGWWGLLQLGAMTFYGGLLGALPCALIFIWWRRLPLWNVADLAIPALFAALCLGRIGCLLNGCDYGRPVAVAPVASAPWWALVNPVLQDEVVRYPVQIMESFVALCLAVGGVLMQRRQIVSRSAGNVGLGVLFSYASARFLLEYLRGDERGWVIEGLLSPAQTVSLAIILGVVAIVSWRLYVRRRVVAPSAGGDA